MERLSRLPVMVLLIGFSGLAMLVPASYASVTGWQAIAGHFFFSALLLVVLALLLGVAVGAHDRARAPVDLPVLLTMLATFGLLPLALALPLSMALPDTGLFNAWWEMVSCLTTTGATLYAGDMLAPPLHLWRAMVGWMGGLIVLVTAVAILAPLRVGGFEITSSPYTQEGRDMPMPGASAMRSAGGGQLFHASVAGGLTPAMRLMPVLRDTLPFYLALTVTLWVALLLAGDPGLMALTRAMGTLSTSGISPVAGPVGVHSGIPGEMIVFAFLIFALSRRLWPGVAEFRTSTRIWQDPELRIGLGVVALFALILFLRHFLTNSGTEEGGFRNAAIAAWGGLFTGMSYLSTTGWTSVDWQGARSWSGLQTPGLLLAGLAMMGGGIATTAGGVKLLRVYALARQSQRELQRIVHPASVGGGGRMGRRLRGEGAYLAFIFFMLFALSIAATVIFISLHRIEFDTAVILSISALTNTGPLAGTLALTPSFEASAGIASDPWLGWSGLAILPKTVLAAAMIVGRIETVAILALITPEFWRR
ncbi:MAG: potassium transporter TrkG [Paracoccus sp. (in: a-proteobacteria)]|nr:potassium transporter TrkG [Paracoccus sp. (in: a-proteobacteria)]